jgi:adenylate cyclase
MARSMRGAVLLRLLVSNGVGATASLLLPFVNPDDVTGMERTTRPILFFAYLVASFVVLGTIMNRSTERALRWVDEGRPPTADERRRVLAIPMLALTLSMVGWVGASVVFTTHFAMFGQPAYVLVAGVFRNLLSGALTGAIAFLLTERVLRPVFPAALSGGSTQQSAIGIRARVLLAWLLGSAIPLVVVAINFVGRDADGRAELANFIWAYVLAGLLAGGVLLASAARSIADPIDRVRHAVARVEAGDLDVDLSVDDGGEIGRLQNGFNRMVHGLRERRQLHDLFGRHVGEEVARRALERGAQLGGESVEASALFVDLVGSTTYAEHHTPDEVVALLNEVFSAVVDAVHAEGGWVNKFEGDAALCVFGPPGGQTDHAAAALRAATMLRRSLRDLVAERGGLDAGIGVATGPVIAGNVGAKDRYEYTVIGDAVNQAARITELAKADPARLLAADETVRAASGTRKWRRADVVVLRGRSAPTQLWAPRAD